MSDSNFNNIDLNLSYLGDEILKAFVILTRPVVYRQLLIIIFVCFLSWLISRTLWHYFRHRFPNVSKLEFTNTRIAWQSYGAALVRFWTNPVIGFLLLTLIILIFEQQRWFFGYLKDSLGIIGNFIIFRTFLISLYALFPAKAVRYYHLRLFAPLFFLFILFRILGLFMNLTNLSQVSLIQVFEEPLTIEAIFVTIAGLYFWFVGLSLVEKICLKTLYWLRGEQLSIDQAIVLVIRYCLIGLGIVILAGYVGISPTAIAAITGGLSVGIGFGLKEVISNFVSGIWLLFEGALKPGDVVMVEGNMSKVVSLGVRATTVQIIKDNSEEIIPNQTFFTDNITTLTKSDNLIRRSLIVGASYKADPQKVLNVILEVARQHPKVLELPTPIAWLINFGDSSIDYELRFWLDDPMIGMTVTSELSCEIWQAFADSKIEIPFPQRDIHIRKD
ncbi:MAG: mechanosensitive ion channel family protein [Microcystaceae cyanobacterium]